MVKTQTMMNALDKYKSIKNCIYIFYNRKRWYRVEKLPFSNAGRVEGQNVFTGSPGVPQFVANAIITPYDAWKQLIHKTIVRTIMKYANEEAKSFFIALQYAHGVNGKNHLVHFFVG